jgi:hypothetical protein
MNALSRSMYACVNRYHTFESVPVQKQGHIQDDEGGTSLAPGRVSLARFWSTLVTRISCRCAICTHHHKPHAQVSQSAC